MSVIAIGLDSTKIATDPKLPHESIEYEHRNKTGPRWENSLVFQCLGKDSLGARPTNFPEEPKICTTKELTALQKLKKVEILFDPEQSDPESGGEEEHQEGRFRKHQKKPS